MSNHQDEFERFEHAGRTVILCRDPDAQSPRDNDGNLCVMACWHRGENLGDRQINSDKCDFDASDRDAFVVDLERDGDKVLTIVPIWIYQHSGISLRAQPERPGYPFNCPWDAGQVGWAYVLKSTADKAGEPGDQARFEEIVGQEVEIYDLWQRGGFTGYIVEDEDGDLLDSCWGFDDVDYCRQQAKESAENVRSKGQVDGGCNATCEGGLQP